MTGVCGALRPSAVSSAMRKARPRARGSMIWQRQRHSGVRLGQSQGLSTHQSHASLRRERHCCCFHSCRPRAAVWPHTATAPSGSPPLPVVCSPIQMLPLVQCKGPSPHPGGPAQSISAASVGSPDCPPNHKLRNTVPSPPPGDQNEGSGQQPQAYLLHAQLAWPHVQWGWRLRASQRHIVLAG